jgi:hypothetical protein
MDNPMDNQQQGQDWQAEDAAERADTMQRWRASPVTQRLAEEAMQAGDDLLKQLLADCSVSADPAVARSYERFRAAGITLAMLSGKGES